MHKWFVQDRNEREIYLTEERWQHIASQHPELRNQRDNVIETVRRGTRRQQPRDPQTYVYRLPCEGLRPPFNGILVVVAFRFDQQEDGGMVPNNFIVTAWGIVMRL